MLRTPTTNISKTYWIVANTSAIIISYIGAALSVLWIIMLKGSKAWFEIYEAAIAAYEENNKYINKVNGNKLTILFPKSKVELIRLPKSIGLSDK